MNGKNVLKQDILFYFISLIYICSFASLIRVSELVNIEEILIGILRLSLPFILLLSSVKKQDKDIKIEGEKGYLKDHFLCNFSVWFGWCIVLIYTSCILSRIGHNKFHSLTRSGLINLAVLWVM